MSLTNPEDILNANSRTLAPAAVGSQVLLMSVVSVVTVVAFNLLRPKNKIIYEPKVKYHEGNKPPPRISDSVFGWLPPLLYTKEPELVEKIGLDAVAFLRFGRLLRWLFLGITILTCGILLPVNIIYNIKNVKPKNRDILSMLTIRDVIGNLLFVHVAVSYLITLLICYVVYVHWREMLRLRHQWYRSPEYLQSFYARTLAILHVPKNHKSDQGIREIYQSTRVPYPTTSVHIGRKVGQLPELIEYHNQTVRQLEQVLVKYLKGGRVANKRPMVRVGGSCGCGGTKRDAIEFYTAKLKRTEAAIEAYRGQIDTHKAENYGFASMAAVPYAHVVAKQLAGKHPKGTDITLAPNPKDIIWANMNKSDSEIARKKIHGFLWLAFVCFLNTVPLSFISVLANLDSLTAYVPFIETWSQDSPTTFAIVSGVLPPAVSGIFGFFLPLIMRWLSQYMGALTHSRLDRAVIARYFSFLVISQLIIFTLIGVIFNSVKEIIQEIGKSSFQEIIHNLNTLPKTINRTYIDQASYWLTFFPLRGFLVVFDLAQIVNLVWLSIKTRIFGRTPRDIREWTQPPEFQYGKFISISNTLFMVAVGLVFAPLAPLVALAACIVFWMSSAVYKFVYITKVETGGRLWNVVVNRLLFSVVMMQILLVLTIGIQHGFRSLQWLSAIPPILIVAVFKYYINRTFDDKFRYFIPTEEEIRTAKVHSERADARGNRLEKRFGHPALIAELFTPMLHAKMMPLLSQVYSGKIGKEQTKLDEYGGQKMEAQVVEGGIKIAAIDQRDLEYDPVMYQRDRGELDWDTMSISSSNYLMSDVGSPQRSGTPFGSTANLLPGYQQYLNQGPASGGTEQFELARLDSPREPLLSPTAQQFYQQTQLQSPAVSHRDSLASPLSAREAPLHRPQQFFDPMPPYQLQQQQSHSRLQSHSQQGSGDGNMAGRGAHKGY
ncbi:hypothetical protein C8J56DRAFT_1005551 [Mycena floridula]|nr:hypothetical protein C8J56DRAFT_1005551 [Mycena floridula]